MPTLCSEGCGTKAAFVCGDCKEPLCAIHAIDVRYRYYRCASCNKGKRVEVERVDCRPYVAAQNAARRGKK